MPDENLVKVINTLYVEIITNGAEEGLRHISTLQNFLMKYVHDEEYLPTASDVDRLSDHLRKCIEIYINNMTIAEDVPRGTCKKMTEDFTKNMVSFSDGEIPRGLVSARCLGHILELRNTQGALDEMYTFYAIASADKHPKAVEAKAKFLQLRAETIRQYSGILFDLGILQLTTAGFTSRPDVQDRQKASSGYDGKKVGA